MHNDRSVLFLVVGRGLLDKTQHGQWVFRYTMVWPIGVVVLVDHPLCHLVLVGFDLGVLDLEGPDGVGGKDLLASEGDLDQPVSLGPLSGPVEVAFSLQEE